MCVCVLSCNDLSLYGFFKCKNFPDGSDVEQ